MPEVTFNGAEGQIEGRYFPGEEENAPIALILHPHPQHGGTMNNRVVYEMYQCFARKGFSVLRFNFRGVGKSKGSYRNEADALLDAALALDWLQTSNPETPQCWISGFSFGAWIAMELVMRRPEITGFVAVAPPANRYDFSFLAPCPSSGLFMHGAEDQNVPIEVVDELVERLSEQRDITIDYRVLEGADHFFKDSTGELAAELDDYLESAIIGVSPV